VLKLSWVVKIYHRDDGDVSGQERTEEDDISPL